jgi:CRP-like cAMP-binding protein
MFRRHRRSHHFLSFGHPSLPHGVCLLGRLTGAPTAELESFLRLSTTIGFEAGATLLNEGTVGSDVLVLLDGELEVTRHGERIARVLPGAVVGELAVLNNEPRNATVRATVASRVAVLSRSEFASVLDSCPVLGRSFLISAVERLTPQPA